MRGGAFDEYLHRYARQDVKRGVARVFVATPADLATEVAGFYTLSAASVSAKSYPSPCAICSCVTPFLPPCSVG